MLRCLRENVALNGEHVQSAVSVHHLRWGDGGHIAALKKLWPSGFDTIITSDTLYYRPEDTYDDLATTIRTLASADATVVLSYMVRHGEEHLFAELLASGGAIANSSESLQGDAVERPQFDIVHRNAADEASLSLPTHATRVVELQRRPTK